jgi:hypothetical protein
MPGNFIGRVAASVLCAVLSSTTRGETPPYVLSTDLMSQSLSAWKTTDDRAWRVVDFEGQKVLELHRQSKYSPKVRSPINIALAKDLVVEEFQLDVKVRSTARDYGHRDLCVFFGYQDPEHFYYVHLGRDSDAHAHSIFLVNGKPRVSIATERTKGTPWTNGWHQVRVTRVPETGEIAVYFDDMNKPVMKGTDKTFLWGQVGVGSFDDVGMFREFVLRGKRRSS